MGGSDGTATAPALELAVRALEHMGEGFLALDRQWRCVHANAAAERLLGRGRDKLLGRNLWEEFRQTVEQPAYAELHRAAATGEPVAFEHHSRYVDAWFEVRAVPGPEGLAVYFHDIESRRSAEAARREAREVETAAGHRLELLAEASSRFSETLEPTRILDALCDLVVPGLARWLLVALRPEVAAALEDRDVPPPAEGGDPVQVVRVVHADVAEHEELLALLEALSPVVDDPHGVGAVTATGRSEYFRQVPDEVLVAMSRDRGVLARMRKLDLGSALTVPLLSRGRTLGAMTLTSVTPYEPLDRTLVEDLARRAAVGLDNALLYRAERRTALTLQRSLLPRDLPKLPGVVIASRYLAATTGREVGGDWYDALPLPDGRLGLAIGDVMGHGMRAAATMGQLRAAVATLALQGLPPAAVLGRLSSTVEVLLDLHLATVAYAVYDPADRTLTAALAGHPPPLLAPVGREPAFLDLEPGAPLGAGPARYPELVAEVAADSTLVFYTDGLVESRDEPLESGMERLRLALADVRLPPDVVCDHLLATMHRDFGAHDDVAVLVFSHTA